MANNKKAFFDFIRGYERPRTENGNFSVTGKRFFVRSYSGTVTHERKRLLSRRIFKIFGALSRLFAYTRTKTYGATALSFGLVTLLFHFMGDLFGAYGVAETASLVIGLCFSLVSIPLLFFEKPLAILMEDIPIVNYIFFELFCIKRVYRSEGEHSIPTPVAVILGVVLSLLGYFVPVWYVACGVGAFIFLCLALASPEFAFFSSFLFLPYLSYIPHSTIVMAAVVALAAFSFVRRAMYGKRVIFFEQYDFFLSLMVGVIMLSGIFIGGVESFASAVVMTVMSLGYFLASNIITNRRLADCALTAIVISSAPPAFIAIGQFIGGAFRSGIVTAFLTETSSTFAAADVYAVFLIVSITCAVTLVRQSAGAVRAFYFLVLLADFLALVLTGELFAVFALLVGFLVYGALKARSFAILLLPLLFMLPYAFFLLPEAVLEPLFSIIPTSLGATAMLELWRASLRAFRDNIFLGIGIGTDSFAEVMSGYGVSGVADSSNLFIELGLEAGIFALICLFLLLAVRLVHRAVYYRYVKRSEVSTLSQMMSVCVFCLLVYGATDHIWSDMSMFYLFFAVFGIGSSTLRVAKKEHDDRVLYFEDTKRSDSSVINVSIR